MVIILFDFFFHVLYDMIYHLHFVDIPIRKINDTISVGQLRAIVLILFPIQIWQCCCFLFFLLVKLEKQQECQI